MDDGKSRAAPGSKGLTRTELDERNAELIRDRLRGQSWEYLGSKYGVTGGQARRVYEKWRQENPSRFEGRDPIHLVHMMLDRLESWVEQLAEIADYSPAEQTKIAAINAQMAAMGRGAELMQATGILPHNLGTLRLELDVRLLATRLVTVLTEHGASVELKRAILEILEPNDALSLPALPNGNG